MTLTADKQILVKLCTKGAQQLYLCDVIIIFQLMSRTSSQIITAFVQTKHQMQLDADKHRLVQFQQTIKKRAQKVKTEAKKPAKTFNQAIQLAEKFKLMSYHKISLKQFEEKFNTNAHAGISDQEAQARLKKDGPNKLSEAEATSWILLLIQQIVTPFSLLLWGGAALCFAAYGIGKDQSNMYLAMIIIAIILITGFISFYQTLKSKALMQSFKDFIPAQTIVIRNGVEKTIQAEKLVVGDLVRVQLGKKIPADLRIVDAQDMKVDNSSLTGQTELLERIPQCTSDNPLQTKNIAFFSTLDSEGTGKGLVFATGDKTFIGQIANLAASAGQDQQMTPLQKEIKRFIVRLTIFSVIIGGILFGLGFAIGYPAILNFVFAIGVITANVPQGLIVQITVGLTLTAQILSKRKVLVKYLNAVQTLGSTSCICSDKTGTLTMNKMTASNIWYNGRMCKAENRQKRGGNFVYEYDINDPGFKALQQVAIVSSVANFNKSYPKAEKMNELNKKGLTDKEKEEQVKKLQIEWIQKLKNMLYLEMPTIGDASESGLIKFFQPLGDIQEIRAQFPVVKSQKRKEIRIPFNSTNKYAYSVNHYQRQDSMYCVFMKGAPENIWKKCKFVQVSGKPESITKEWEELFQKANKSFGRNGERVLGFAKLHLPKSSYPANYTFDLEKDDLLSKGLCFVGMLSLTDPPRDSVPYAVLKCHSAGIKVIMVTGDQPVTAAAIAKKCNIITEETVNEIAERTGQSKEECFGMSNAIVIHGDELTQMAVQDQGLPQSQQGKKLQKWLSKTQIVFARTSPAQKLIIVKGCQKLREIVAVTGDGVNDSPAIKKADIGISMGITGTDVAKDAADMILLNDDFSSIVVGVEQGRKIYDNIKKSICYALTSQIGQMLPFIAFIFFQMPSAVTTVGVLYLSIGSDLVPAISLAYELGELDLMTRKPRGKDQHMVTMTLMAQAYGYMGWIEFWAGMISYYAVFNDFGFPPSQLNMLANVGYYASNAGDVYNPTHQTFGNTYLYNKYIASNSGACPSDSDPNYSMVDWVYLGTAKYDLRVVMLRCTLVGGKPVFSQIISSWGSCNVQQISPYTNLPVCYTTEACKYAQTAYLLGVVICQIVNVFACKTRRLSVISQGASNTFLLFAITTEVALALLVTFVLPLNVGFGFRDNIFMHYGTPALPFAMIMLLVDEVRKYLIRKLPQDQSGKPHWFTRAALW